MQRPIKRTKPSVVTTQGGLGFILVQCLAMVSVLPTFHVYNGSFTYYNKVPFLSYDILLS